VGIVHAIISVMHLLLLARAILSWLPFDDSSALYRFLHITTEPILLPIRKMMDRIEFLAGFPIDLSFIVAYLLLLLISALLPAVRF